MHTNANTNTNTNTYKGWNDVDKVENGVNPLGHGTDAYCLHIERHFEPEKKKRL